jgi:phenylacetate-CoA ligase
MNLKPMVDGAAHLIVKRYASPFWIRRRWLNRTQWLSYPELQEVQLGRLKKLIRHCYDTVPYYRQVMDDRGIRADDVKSLQDIEKFPIINKKEVLKAGDSIVSTRYPRWALRKGRTGGSTGTPMLVYRSMFSLGTEHAFIRRQFDWAGVPLREKTAWIFQRVVAQPEKKGARLYYYDPVLRELTLSAYRCSPETALEYAEVIQKHGIEVVVGYPSSVYLMAKTCLNEGFKLDLRVMLSTWEAMTGTMRKTISEAFGCKVFDYYGSGERVVAIHKCDHATYHVVPEYGLTELLPIDDREEGYYRVVSTGFWNKGMPLIRYDVGDVVAMSGDRRCGCGREFPVVDSIVGKEGDVIQSPSGVQLGVTAVVQVLYTVGGTDNVLETQFVQDAVDHVRVEYVPGSAFTPDDLENMKRAAARLLPDDLKVDFKQVEAVRRTPMGKIRPIVSELASNPQVNRATEELKQWSSKADACK